MTIRLLRVEDLLLAAWNAAGVPLLVASGSQGVVELGGAPDPLAGVLHALAVVAAIVAIATRPAGLPLAAERLEGLRYGLIGPLAGAVAFLAGSASAHLGVNLEGPITGLGFIAIVAAMIFSDRLPVIDPALRRALILPFVLVCAGIFNQFAADLLDGVDLVALLHASLLEGTGFAIFIAGMLLAGLAAFYASLVVAPRVLADPESGCAVWPLRFVLFLLSAGLGIGWLTVLTA